MNKNKRIILLCEKGWQGVREFSVFLTNNGLKVYVLIKGYPEKKVRNMITPYSGIHNIFIPPKVYSLWVFVYFFFNLQFSKVCVFALKKQRKVLVNFFRLHPYFIQERQDDYHILDNNKRQMRPKDFLQRIC